MTTKDETSPTAETSAKPARVRIENVNHPGASTTVDARLYGAMREAVLKVLPEAAPGLTEEQLRHDVLPHLPEDLFPGGAKAGWWSKAVQLDLEAKGLVVRELARPLRWHRPPEGVSVPPQRVANQPRGEPTGPLRRR